MDNPEVWSATLEKSLAGRRAARTFRCMHWSVRQQVTLFLVGGAAFAARIVSAQQRDAGPPTEPSISSADAAATPTAPIEEPLPMLTGGVEGRAPEAPAPPPAAERAFTTQRQVGLLLGGTHGYGTGVRLRASRFAVDLTGGFRPVFATHVAPHDDTPEFRLLGGFEFAISPVFMVYRAGPRTELGFAAAYAYNTLLGHGMTVAFHIDYDLSEHLSAHFFIGPTIFPAAESRVRAEADFPAGGSVSSGLSALQEIADGSLAFFP